jgi:threonine-phosphate decarboxylase
MDEDRILCGNGASDLIFRICASRRPRAALTLAPTFSEYERSVCLFGGEMRYHMLYEREDFGMTHAILDSLTADLEMLFLCNPNNPTGRLAEPSLMEEVLECCAHNGTVVVLDECFMGFTGGESMQRFLDRYPNLLILNAFTKLYGMAGLRLGWLMGDPGLLHRIKPFGPEWSVSIPAQIAGIAALGEPEWEARTRNLMEEERTYVRNSFVEMGLSVCRSDGNFLLVKSPVSLYEPLKKRRILVRNCVSFKGLDENFMRVGLKTREQNQALLDAVKEAL